MTTQNSISIFIVLTVVAVAALAGCGRKGDLVLPDKTPKPPAEKSATAPPGQ